MLIWKTQVERLIIVTATTTTNTKINKQAKHYKSSNYICSFHFAIEFLLQIENHIKKERKLSMFGRNGVTAITTRSAFWMSNVVNIHLRDNIFFFGTTSGVHRQTITYIFLFCFLKKSNVRPHVCLYTFVCVQVKMDISSYHKIS